MDERVLEQGKLEARNTWRERDREQTWGSSGDGGEALHETLSVTRRTQVCTPRTLVASALLVASAVAALLVATTTLVAAAGGTSAVAWRKRSATKASNRRARRTTAVASTAVSTTLGEATRVAAAVASTTVATRASAVASTAASAAGAAGVGEVDADAAAVELLLVEAGDGVLGLDRGAEGDEAEATRTARVAIAHHDRLQTNKKKMHKRRGSGTRLRAGLAARRADTDIEDLAVRGECL